MQIDLVLFDVCGVLVDLWGGPATLLRNTANPWGVWLSSSAVRRFESGCCDWEEFVSALIEETTMAAEPEEIYECFASWPLGLSPGAVDLLRKLKCAGYLVATLSNTNPVHWPRITGGLRLDDHISDHFPSHITGHLKPSRRAFQCVIDHYRCQAGHVVFFDDNRVNVESARKLGMIAFEATGVGNIKDCLDEVGVIV